MTTRKPKTADITAAERWSRDRPQCNLAAHLAGQRSARARMRKEIGEVLNGLLKQHETSVPEIYEGIYRAMTALKIKETK